VRVTDRPLGATRFSCIYQFGIHSLRSGGTSATAQAGIPDNVFKKHGRWYSETTKDGCIKDSNSAN